MRGSMKRTGDVPSDLISLERDIRICVNTLLELSEEVVNLLSED